MADLDAIRKVTEEMRSASNFAWANRLEAALAEPDYEPLTEETKDGLYWWCDGEGGDWLPLLWWRKPEATSCLMRGKAVERAMFINGRRRELLSGLVRPLVPTPGPTLPKPIQGEKPVPVVVTDLFGNQWHGMKASNLIAWNSQVRHENAMPVDYKWEASDE